MEEAKTITWDWKSLFEPTELHTGYSYASGVAHCEIGDREVRAKVKSMYCAISNIPNSYSQCCRDLERDDFQEYRSMPRYRGYYGYRFGMGSLEITNRGVTRFTCSCKKSSLDHVTCPHMAAALYLWERKNGALTFTETEEEKERRIAREARLAEKERIRMEREAEKKRREEIKEEKQGQKMSVAEAIGLQAGEDVYFNMPSILEGFTTDRYEAEEYGKIRDLPRGLPEVDATVVFHEAFGQILKADLTVYEPWEPEIEYDDDDDEYGEYDDDESDEKDDGYDRDDVSEDGAGDAPEEDGSQDSDERVPEQHYREREVRITVSPSKALVLRCDCRPSYWDCSDRYGYQYHKERIVCAHALAALDALHAYIRENDPGDATDNTGHLFLEQADARDGREKLAVIQKEAVTKHENIVFYPEIERSRYTTGNVVTFRVRVPGGNRDYIAKKLPALLSAWREGRPFELTKKASVDFSRQDFDAASTRWAAFAEGCISEIEGYNERMHQKARYAYSDNTLSIGSEFPLEGGTMDRFYELAEGTTVSGYAVGPWSCKARMQISDLRGKGKKILGVSVTGSLPVLLDGITGKYLMESGHLARVDGDQMGALESLRRVAKADGSFFFNIGARNLASFYYRALPALLESGAIDVQEEGAGSARKLLPPEAEIAFFVDLEEEVLTMRAEASYDGRAYPLYRGGAPAEDAATRDLRQEEKASDAARTIFPEYDEENGRYRKVMNSADDLFEFLTDGSDLLSVYGEVRGSSALRGMKVRSVPQLQVSVGVSMDAGLLDLDIKNKDMDAKELLAFLKSYRQKKKYYRLKSGDFISLRDPHSLDELEHTLEDMGVTLEEAAKHKVSMPAYRALYVDRLLEEHEEVVAQRDRTLKALVKNFKTIREADYELPASLEDVMRPYQAYGFRWLSVLSHTGFGGILADEMGLGKTVQLLSLLVGAQEEARASGESLAASLVVCPASLLFNWLEEAERFAPSLVSVGVAGTASERKEIIKGIGADGHADLYVTSYELLRRDVALYDGVSFHCVALDEAQYIKNHRAVVSRSVKVLRARHRFALTGTPIENRLSELWSIFDFLMPGFLYGSEEFSRRFEHPIVKGKDEEATERLRAMVAPFILRRLKSDVLTDLPDKLEEVRYARFESRQQKVYDAQVVHMRELLDGGLSSGEDKLKVLAELTRLRQICCDPSLLFEDYDGDSAKRTAVLDLIASAMDGGHRMLLFSQFTSMLALLEEDFRQNGIEYFKITGSTPKEERLRLVHEFNEGSVPVFLISLKAGGTGLNLTGADVVIHYDPWWNMAAQNQATDRAHRIGQTRQVTVFRLIAKDTIEEKILRLQEMKQDLANALVTGNEQSLASLSEQELLELLS